MSRQGRKWIALSVLVLAAGMLLVVMLSRDHSGAPADAAQPNRVAREGERAPETHSGSPRKGSTHFAVIATNAPAAVRGMVGTNWVKYRLSNTREDFKTLARSDGAVLLRNALIDTRSGAALSVPEHLQSAGEPGSYIVQAAGAITAEFREAIQNAGGTVVSYVPNNAYLVRGSEAVAAKLKGTMGVQAVLPFEPYYKLDGRLLPLVVEKQLSPYGELNVVSFPGEAQQVKAALEKMGASVVREPEHSPLGEILVVKAPADALARVAQIPEVQIVGVHYQKRPANDLARVKLRVSRTSTNKPPPDASTTQYGAPQTNNYLTGSGVLVAVADTGVDKDHPDIAGRTFGLTTDFDGHGTHVIGSILGDGTKSDTVGGDGTNSAAQGSLNGANFYGMAPAARAYVMDLDLPDAVLQERAALTNALICNDSWGFPDSNDYDIYAASYDGAVRDSLPGVTGEQEVAYVFAAGNSGGGSADGLNGIPGSIVSPATAKNVVSVGAVDEARFITNVVVRGCDTNGMCETNSPWLGQTDSDNQVSPYSSRGNAGLGIEGPFGRIKPDVVAPGSMSVSLRSSQYEEPTGTGSTNVIPYRYNSVTVAGNATNLYALNIPAEAVRLDILAITNDLSPANLTLLLGADIDAIPTTALASNSLVLDPTTSPALRQGTLYYTVANPASNTVNFDLVLLLTVTNDVGNFFQVLSNLNGTVGPWYRYESGSSMAAAKISGMMALFQEYLNANFSLRPSPALLKALLVNGARSLSQSYNLDSHPPVNHQGWGIANLSNSIPSGLTSAANTGPMRFFDESTTNALSTGGTHVYQVSVPDEARSYPLRVTLVWSDPPGNPISSFKLVNDLNLVVSGDVTNVLGQGSNATSTTSTLLWVGNNFPPGSDFTDPLVMSSTDSNAAVSTNLVSDLDRVRDIANNVENVYIRPPLASSYTVIVKGHRVNVNALNSHSNAIGQDYALVIASGNVAPSNNVNLTVSGPTFTNDPSPRISALVPATTNGTTAALFNQRVGANSPLIVSTNGATNQWCFFTYTNVPMANFTNVAILTFFAPELSLPRTNQADIDLYVLNGASGPNLFTLDPAAVAASRKSLSRGGTEYVVYSNAQPNQVFYVGVKSEDQQAAMFSILAISSDRPFSTRDSSNNIVASAFPLPADIPDGTPDQPGGTNLIALVIQPDATVQRVFVTNSIFHEEAGDLIGVLSHTDSKSGQMDAVTLNNHRTWNGLDTTVYDDSDQGDLGDLSSIPPVAPSDGPGSLRDFIGHDANGVWQYSISDNALFHTGVVENLTLVIQPSATTNNNLAVDATRRIGAGRWLYAAFDVPADATNVHACVGYLSGAGPVEIYLRQGDFPDRTTFDKALTNILNPGACLDLGLVDSPPLSQGRYYVAVYNAGAADVVVRLTVALERSLQANRGQTVASDGVIPLIDDATTNSTIFVTNRGRVASVEVDVRIDHPRVSDLVLHLVDPQGKRILLAENRGRDTTNGYGVGISSVVTNAGARILDDGFEFVDRSSPYYSGGAYPVGQIISGWLVETGNVDVVHVGIGLTGPSHTGTNGVDLNGQTGGSILTNVTTTTGKTYSLSFAYCKNPDNTTPPSVTAAVGVGTQSMNFTYNLPNSYANPNWLTTSIVVRATSNITPLRFSSVSPSSGAAGMFIDTIRMDEVEIKTNAALYATFTDDPLKAFLPIKFAPPPFGDTNFNGTNLFINGFEGAATRAYTNGQSFVGWTVRSNSVYVQSNSAAAYSDTNYLLLRTGTVTRVLPTIAGKEYVLQFATRTSRPILYNTGVDDDGIPLPAGSVDPHYFVASNSFSGATNAAYVINTNSTAFANSWINGSLPNSRWIGIHPNQPANAASTFGFKTHFDLTGYNWKNVSLTGRFQVDGPTWAVLVNGANVPSALIPSPQQSYSTGFVTRTITGPYFVSGINTLEFVLTNRVTQNGFDPAGFQAQFAPNAIQATNLPGAFPPLYKSVGQIRLPGSYTNYFTALSDTWRVESVTFVAPSNNMVLEFSGVTPGVWLDHIQMRETGRKYYLPEEPLAPLVGDQAFGRWKLEVWDDRLGAMLGATDLISWRLNLTYVRTNPPLNWLTNAVPYVGTVFSNNLQYFVVNVPCDTATVTNTLTSLTPPGTLDLLFNQDAYPTGTEPGDVLLLTNVTSGVSVLNVGYFPLARRGTYVLAVRNTNPAQNNGFQLAVDIDCSSVAPSPFIAPSQVSYGPSGFTLQWSGVPSEQFSIQYTDDLNEPWNAVPQPVVSDSGVFTFTDDGTLTGGLPQHRFYRLLRQ